VNTAFIAICGAAIGAVLTFIVAMKRERRDELQLLIDNLRKDNEELRERVMDMEKRITAYEHREFEQQKEITKLHAILYARDAGINPRDVS
jgi:uncharacterized protein YlxW (UPF0749 family)